MSIEIPESQLPQHLTALQAVEAAYSAQLADVARDLSQGLPVLVECDKDVTVFAFMHLRDRLRSLGLQCEFLDGRPRDASDDRSAGFLATVLAQLRRAVRGAAEKKVVVVPHLDVLTTSHGDLTTEAREVIPLLYENPELVWLGFLDPSFTLPTIVSNLFPRRYQLLGVDRARLAQLVTQRESRKFGRGLNPWLLYKHVSGMNPVRLRRLLESVDAVDYPEHPAAALAQIRQATTTGALTIPDVDLDRDIGGYERIKQRLRRDVLDLLVYKDSLDEPQAIRHIERLVPRGMIFWGPPGTGKTLFAKAMATAIGAAITIVSGPELKSRWVGESEARLRQVFHQARQSAPAIIVFDELDSFAAARGTFTGSGVEHSMVNQLLTEMDGFRREELVFVVGTTNFVDALDPALLRPGRFEFALHIDHPSPVDRRAILEICGRLAGLEWDADVLEYVVERTESSVPGAPLATRFSGDHLNALCRALARDRLRERRTGAVTAAEIDAVLATWSTV